MATLTQNVIAWNLPGGDQAQTSIWVNYGGNPTTAQALARFQADVIDSVWPSGAGGVKSYHSSAVILASVQTRIIEPIAGGVVSTATAAYSRAGTAGGNSLPAEVSTVLSLRTGLSGASYRGRLYLPPNSVTQCSSLGRLVAGDLTNILAAWQAAFVAMNADTTYTSADIVVRSRLHQVSTVVVSIDLGDVFDAQRRRRNQLTESRSSAVV